MTRESPSLLEDVLCGLPREVAADVELTPISGGWCVKHLPGGQYCVDVIEMLYNWRVMLTPADAASTPHCTAVHGWCYFGHGLDENGRQRTMDAARTAAVLAAAVWDGNGDPPGFDKQAF